MFATVPTCRQLTQTSSSTANRDRLVVDDKTNNCVHKLAMSISCMSIYLQVQHLHGVIQGQNVFVLLHNSMHIAPFTGVLEQGICQ